MKREASAARIGAGLLLCALLLCLGGCASDESRETVKYLPLEHSAYADALRAMLPGYETEEMQDSALLSVQGGFAAEALDVQALPALETGVAGYWYPQYLATAVIAVDRDRTSTEIGGWSSLADIPDEVGYMNSGFPIGRCALLSAMAYGLEGEGYSLTAATELLAALNRAGRLRMDSSLPPVLICFDFQAVQMAKGGRNMEIIVPEQGTFAYIGGVLSDAPLVFAQDADDILLDAGLRLPDGRCAGAPYPDAGAYLAASQVADPGHWAAVAQDIIRTLRRDVLKIRVFSTADAREHQLAALVYIAVMLLWAASVMWRAMQRGVRRAALLTGLILLCWVAVRLVKYQTLEGTAFNRYLWYSFYLFQLALPLVLLWLSRAIDRPGDALSPPGWLCGLSALNGLLVLLVFTNDLHNLVFRLDLSSPWWGSEYEYGVGVVPVTAAWALPLIAALVTMMAKSAQIPGRKARVFPLLLCAFIALYGLGYALRVPVALHSDMTMMVGLFALLFFEASIRSGMIPVNTKYIPLFAGSTLRMQLLDRDGAPALASASAMPLDRQAVAHILSGSGAPMLRDEGTALFACAISGGFAAWEEDISALNRLQEELEQSVKGLEAANALLREEEKIKRQLGEAAEKKQLMEQLEAAIAEKLETLGQMTRGLPETDGDAAEIARIAVLLCFIKRRCNLFFRERESDLLPADELGMYIDELAELAVHADVNIAMVCMLKGSLPARRAALFYELFYEVAAWASARACRHIVGHLGAEGGAVAMRLLPAEDIRSLLLGGRLASAIAEAGGTLSVKDLDDAVGITLSFPEGGEADD